MTNFSRAGVFPMVLPEKGPLAVPDKISFLAGEAQEIDLSQLIANGWLDYVSGVYVDNLNNNGELVLICNGTNQQFTVPGNSSGYFPLLLPNPPKVILTHEDTADVTFQWYNVPVFPMLIQRAAGGGTTAVNITAIDGTPITGPNLPINFAQFGGVDVGPALPVTMTAPTMTDFGITLAAGGQ